MNRLKLTREQVDIILRALRRYIQWINMVQVDRKKFKVAKETLEALEITSNSNSPE